MPVDDAPSKRLFGSDDPDFQTVAGIATAVAIADGEEV